MPMKPSVLVFVLSLVLTPLSRAADTPQPPAGAKRTLRVSAGLVPVATSGRGYEAFRAAVRKRSLSGISALLDDRRLVMIPPGEIVEIIAAHDDRPAAPSIYLPYAEVRLADGKPLVSGLEPGSPFLVPMACLRESGERPLSGESKLPTFRLVQGPSKPSVGAKMFLMRSEPDESIAVVKDMFDFEAYIKATRAGDRVGLTELEERKRLAWVDPLTRILVVEVHSNQFIADGLPAVEGRILDGPLSGQSVWVPAQNVCVPRLQIK